MMSDRPVVYGPNARRQIAEAVRHAMNARAGLQTNQRRYPIETPTRPPPLVHARLLDEPEPGKYEAKQVKLDGSEWVLVDEGKHWGGEGEDDPPLLVEIDERVGLTANDAEPIFQVQKSGSGWWFRDDQAFPFFARITATSALGSSDSKFLYTIEEVSLSVTSTDVTATTLTGGRAGYAVNTAEIANEGEAGIAFGVDRDGADYPDGFDPRPITGAGTSNSHKTNQIVTITRGSSNIISGQPVYHFDRQGHHDGVCDS